MCLSVKDNKVGGGPNYIGGAFELSLAADSLPKTVTRYDGGMTAVEVLITLAVPLNCPWQGTLCQTQSHGMTSVSLSCMPLDNCPWQDIFIYVAVSVSTGILHGKTIQ